MPAESYPRYSSRCNPCRSSGFEARFPTYPMIPHIRSLLAQPARPPGLPPKSPPEDAESRALAAELSSHESSDASTGLIRQLPIFGLREDSDQRFSAGRPNQDPTLALPGLVEALDLFEDGRRERLLADGNVLLRLWPAGHHACRLAELPPLERTAQEEPGGEPVAGDVVAQIDDVTRLLASEEGAFALQRFEHVPVA